MDPNIKNKISIHMCTYNRAHFIQQAINSVLKQTYTNWELLILDDASTDNTESIILPYLKDSRIRYIKNEKNLGITKNRNKALSLSTGEYIAVLDSDDVWVDKEKLSKQISFLNQNEDYALVGTNMEIIDSENKKITDKKYETENTDIKNNLLIKNQFCHSSVLYRTKIVKDMDGYDESLMSWEDYDLWLRLGKKYKLANLDIISTSYRIHPNQSNSRKMFKALKCLQEIINNHRNSYTNYRIAIFVNFLRKIRTLAIYIKNIF